ncbi:MAG: azurin [Myxococcota bacterium]
MKQTAENRRKFLGYLLGGAAAAPFLLSACSGGDAPKDASAPKAPAPKAPAKPEPAAAPEPEAKAAPAPTGEKQAVTLTVGDNIAYSTKLIEVKAGSTVEVTVKHTGKLPKEAMGHNFVLLKQGTDMGKFAAAAMSAAATNYVPDAMKDSVIAATKLVGGGESDTVSFTAPAPGEYQYLCSFPGHYAAMNGKLVVS